MFKNNLKTAWRNILKHKAFSAINVTGLAIGMACCLLILFWVQDELSYDKFHRNAGRIFRIVSDWTKYNWDGIPGTPSPLAPAVQEQLPEVESAARFSWHNRKVFRYKEKAFYEDRGIIVDPSFFKIFSFPLLKGNWETAFTGPADIVITETLAAKYFGDADPMGKAFEVEGESWVVRGVLKAVPRNSTFQFDFASSFQFIDKLSGFSMGWGAFNFNTFLLLREGADVSSLGQKITDIGFKNESPQVKGGVRFRPQPMKEVHLDATPYQMAMLDVGDAKYVYLFSVIAVFVLLIACSNFMNLSTARSGLRAKEVGLRKTIGAVRGEIIRQFFGESFLLVGAAALIALVFVRLLIPAFNRLSGKSLSLDLLRPEYLAGLAAIILVTGLTAGFYPALVLSAFRPVKVLKGDFHSGGKGAAFRKILVVFQFSLSIILLISTVVVVRQFRYMRNAKLGFDKDNVVQIPVKENIGKNYEAVKARLLQNPAVLAVTGQSYSFAETASRSSGNFDWDGRDPNNIIDMIYTGVEFGFFEAMNMTIIEGRAFSKDHASDAREALILNEQAIREMRIKDPVGKWFSISKNRKGTIIGVAKDVHFRSFHHKVEPCVFYITNLAAATEMGLVLVKIDGNRTREALAHIQRVWKEFNTVSPFEFRFLDETYDRLYGAERRMSRVFTVFAGLAVSIACLGLLGLASFMAERRTKEIGIRKVLGASTGGIVILISSQLTKWVLAANIIAWPVAYFAMNKLLHVYAYRVSLNWPVFALPSLAAFVLACLTVGFQSLRTARTNPANALRYE